MTDLSAAVRKTSAEMEEWHGLSEKEPWCSWDCTTSSITTRVTHALRMVLWLVNIFNSVHCWCSPLGRITLKSHWPVTYETRSPWASLLWRRGDLKAEIQLTWLDNQWLEMVDNLGCYGCCFLKHAWLDLTLIYCINLLDTLGWNTNQRIIKKKPPLLSNVRDHFSFLKKLNL